MSEREPDEMGGVENLAGTRWDAVMVGAGPAGGAAAALLAGRGWKVLLVEKSRWPREKVCGGCLNAVAVRVLEDAGMGGVLRGGERIERTIWCVGSRQLELAVPGGVAILRAELDARIVQEAVERGCQFLPGVSARILAEMEEGARLVELRCGDLKVKVRAGVVLAGDGIGGSLLNEEPWAKWRVARHGWMGVAATCGGRANVETGAVQMHVGRGGYVGLVRLADGRVHVAAAVEARECQRAGGPGALMERILAGCQAEVPADLTQARFGGTGVMTRTRGRLGGHRVLAIGDACGYVEPFTGEGMGWALVSAREAVALLPGPGEAWAKDLAEQWRARHWAAVGRGQRWCKALRTMMHHPGLAAAGLAVGRALPAAGRWLAAGVCGIKRVEAGQGVVG